MKRIIYDEPIPIKLWLDDIEPGALTQARNLARLPFAFGHIALMPDCHEGFGMPIGGIMAARDVIIPNAVGVDIGCGMCAVQTSLEAISKKTLEKIITDISRAIPVGFKHHPVPPNPNRMPVPKSFEELPIVAREFKKATFQLGTLGGGNHFIEIQKGSDGKIWIMVHSGSRNIGKQVADYYNRLAVDLNEKWKTGIPRSAQLAFLHFDSNEGRQYFAEMNYCIEFAFENRRLMVDIIKEIFADHFPGRFSAAPTINIAHNYAAIETHFGQQVILHRKGATKAGSDTIGIIPGSQGDTSYIVKGKGNPESFESCSHGAGRKMGRKEAIRKLNFKEELSNLEKQGIIHSLKKTADLEEAMGAYKDIGMVMKNQNDLVEVLVELRPLGVIKG